MLPAAYKNLLNLRSSALMITHISHTHLWPGHGTCSLSQHSGPRVSCTLSTSRITLLIWLSSARLSSHTSSVCGVSVTPSILDFLFCFTHGAPGLTPPSSVPSKDGRSKHSALSTFALRRYEGHNTPCLSMRLKPRGSL